MKRQRGWAAAGMQEGSGSAQGEAARRRSPWPAPSPPAAAVADQQQLAKRLREDDHHRGRSPRDHDPAATGNRVVDLLLIPQHKFKGCGHRSILGSTSPGCGRPDRARKGGLRRQPLGPNGSSGLKATEEAGTSMPKGDLDGPQDQASASNAQTEAASHKSRQAAGDATPLNPKTHQLPHNLPITCELRDWEQDDGATEKCTVARVRGHTGLLQSGDREETALQSRCQRDELT